MVLYLIINCFLKISEVGESKEEDKQIEIEFCSYQMDICCVSLA